MKKANKPKLLKPAKNPAGMRLLRTLRGHTQDINGIAFSPDGKKIASNSGDKTKLWETDSGNELFTLKGTKESSFSISFSPDGKKIATGSFDRKVRIWDADSGKEMNALEGHEDAVVSVSFSPHGNKLASGAASRDCTIKIWDIDLGKNLATLKGHQNAVWSVAFSPDGKKIASGSHDSTVRIWDADSGKNLMTLEGHQNAVRSVDFNPDGKTIASGSDDKTIRIWNVQTKKLMHILEGHTSGVVSCVFTPDSQLLASKAYDNTIRLWRTDTWQTVAIVAEPSADKWAPEMGFHPSKPILAAHGENDTVIKLWELDYKILLGKDFISDSVLYTTAKIALVGDSGVGKTGLGWRIAHGSFKEHSSTHGQQFWVIDELGKNRTDGTECEAVLWDLAGQQDYRLVHALFLKDVDLALILFDPGNREKPLSGVEYWLKQLSSGQTEHCKPCSLVLVLTVANLQ